MTAKKERAKAYGDAVRATILATAQNAQGFAVGGHKTAQYHCNILIGKGVLYRAWVHYKLVRYFTTQAAADLFIARNRDKAKSPNPENLSYARVGYVRGKAGQPCSKPAPRPDAEIVHTAKTRYSSRMMTDRYAVSVGGAA